MQIKRFLYLGDLLVPPILKINLLRMKNQEHPVPVQLEGINNFSKLLDTRFRIPGTDIRFGVDFLIGLVPYAGDIMGFLFSCGLLVTMIRHGASGQILGKMIFNIVLDLVVGSIPILGDVFDLFYKANRRNYHLLEEHYGEGKYQGSIWRVVIPVILGLSLILILMFWIVWALTGWLIAWMFGG